MKNVILLFVLALVAMPLVFAQAISDVSTGTLLSPSLTASKLLEASTVVGLRVANSTRSLVQSRGVSGKEQLKDEMVVFNEALVAGKVKSIAEVGQPALRELFEEIASDEEQMEEIRILVGSGSELYQLATAVSLALLIE